MSDLTQTHPGMLQKSRPLKPTGEVFDAAKTLRIYSGYSGGKFLVQER